MAGKEKGEPEDSKQDKSTAAKMKARAKELDKEITAYDKNQRESAMSLGWAAAEMKRGNLWVMLGHEDEPAYRLAKNIGRSTYFSYRRLAEAFYKEEGGLTRARFLTLKAENAKHLAKLTDKLRFNEKLLDKAATLTEEEFQKVMVKFQAQEDRVEEGEVVVTFKMRMPESRRAFILETLDEFAKEHELDASDQSRVLELALAEYRGRNHVVTETMKAVQHLRRGTEILSKPNGHTLAEVSKEVIMIHQQVFEGFAKASGLSVGQAKSMSGGVDA